MMKLFYWLFKPKIKKQQPLDQTMGYVERKQLIQEAKQLGFEYAVQGRPVEDAITAFLPRLSEMKIHASSENDTQLIQLTEDKQKFEVELAMRVDNPNSFVEMELEKLPIPQRTKLAEAESNLIMINVELMFYNEKLQRVKNRY